MIRTAGLALLGLLAAAPAIAADPPGLVHMEPAQQRTVGLKLAAVTRREITEPVRVAGTVAFDQGHVAVLRPFAQGRVVRLLAQPGDPVRAGQPLATLYMPALADSQASLAAARAAVGQAQADLAVARDALRRGEILAADGALSRAEAERRRLAVAQAQAGLLTQRARAAALEGEIRREGAGPAPGMATLAAPIDGVVVSVGITPGELVDVAGDAFTVADLSVVLVLAQIPEASVHLLAVGNPARVTLPAESQGSGRAWAGTVAALGAALDTNARTLPARIRLPNPDAALRAGMQVEVTLTSDRGRSGLVVPAAAIQLVGNRRVAFTSAGDGRYQSHDLRIGVERPDWAEVQSGLSLGDQVVTQGSFALKALLQKSLLDGAG